MSLQGDEGEAFFLVYCFLLSLYLFRCGCKSKHKNDTNKQIINKMRYKTTYSLFYTAKENKKIIFNLF